jgi:hypothetical protein
MTRPASRLLAAITAVGAAIVASLIGGVGVGHASTSFSAVISPLIGTNANEVQQVSFGGQIGYHLVVQNTDTSNTTHVQVVVKVPTATFKDATDPSCAAAKGDASTMICSPFGGTVNSFQTYTVDFRFTAPPAPPAPPNDPIFCPAPSNPSTLLPCVNATPSVSIAAQTQGGKQNGNNGTTVYTGDTTPVFLSADGSTDDTFLRHGENASAGGPQTFSTQLPGTLLGEPFGLQLGIHNETQTGTPICPTCLAVDTDLTIPAASLVGNAGNPFYDATTPVPTVNPYGWTMSATAATSFKLTGVFHIDDANHGAVLPIPACAVLPFGGPTSDDPVCYDTLTSKNKAGVQNLAATGRGLENGKVGFG